MFSLSVVALLAGAQHSALTVLSRRLGQPYEGLSAAAKEARRRGILPPVMVRKCERLDTAAHWARHCTPQRVDQFSVQLVQALDATALGKAHIDAHLCHVQASHAHKDHSGKNQALAAADGSSLSHPGALPHSA